MCFILDPETGPGTGKTRARPEDRDAERTREMFGLGGTGRDVFGTIEAARRAMTEPTAPAANTRIARPRATLPGLPLIGGTDAGR